MRPSPVLTAMLGIFFAAIGAFFVYMSLSHRHADVALTSLVAGLICFALSGVCFWGTSRWR